MDYEDLIVELFSTEGRMKNVLLNWDEECLISIAQKTGFIIKDPPYANVSRKDDEGVKKKIKKKHGIYSPIYGTDWSDDDAIEDHYRCQCGNLKAKVYEGMTCKECNTVVKYLDVDMKTTGWIILNNHKIIQPLYFNMLKEIIDKQKLPVFNNMIHPEYKLNEDGHVYVDEFDKDEQPFFGIGIPEFEERFYEIMEYYRSKNPKKSGMIDILIENKKNVFAKSIPVYSSFLRPESPGYDRNYIHKANKLFGPMVSKVRLLNRETKGFGVFKDDVDKMSQSKVISSLHDKLLEAWEDTFERINGKFGQIRGEVISGRLNYTFRTVIVPNPELKADEIIVSYKVFLEAYRYEIISMLVNMTNCTYNQANVEWSMAGVTFNRRIHQIMLHIIKKFKPHVLLNRNPTINVGSLMPSKIISVRPELSDNDSTEISTLILTAYNADFDGDQLNKYSMKFQDITEAFNKTMSPRKRMFINSNDGLMNSEFNLIKDQQIGLWAFNNQ